MLNKKLQLALLGALCLPTLAFSADLSSQDIKPPHVHSVAAEQIANINERLALLSAQLAELEMQAKIAEKQAELSKAKNPVAPTTFSDNYVPSVDYIDAVDGKYKASLYLQGGNTQSVRVGDKVGAWTVKQIKMDSVTVQKGKEVVYLGFGSYSGNPDMANSLTGNNQVPQIPR
jgi:type IV pilus biogenesis protein PilP